jgi:hypothetical protein
MTRALAQATSHAELRALLADLRGPALNAIIEELGLTCLPACATLARKRETIELMYGRRLDSLAIERAGRA